MFMGKRGLRAESARRRRGFIRLRAEALESRELLAIDLATIATTPYGVQNVALQAGGGAGWSVVDVGNTTGSGYDDYLIGGPSVVRSGNNLILGSGSNSQVYLVFGSRQVNAGTIDFALLNSQQRTGDLGQLGNTTQTNPINGTGGLPFDGLTFITSQNTSSRLGASVTALGDLNGDGLQDFMIGAPGALDANGVNAGTGRAYIIYGSTNLVRSSGATHTIDLDNALTFPTNVVTLESTLAGSQLGASGAGLGNVLGDGGNDVAIGAPGASVNGQLGNGEVGVLSGAFLSTPRTGVISFNSIGQTGGLAGLMFIGNATGDQAGFSVAGGINFDGNRSSANQSINDILIGAPQTTTGSGQAYLVYGALNLTSFATSQGGVLGISLSRVGTTGTTALPNVPGITFTGTAGDGVGYAVSSAGDFNGDGFSDILIGAPNAGGTGIAALIEGRAFSNQINQVIPLNAIPTGVQAVEFAGATTGALAGFSLTAVGRINADAYNEIAIGSPGYNAGQGTVYVIPGNPDLFGNYTLSDSVAPVMATQINLAGSVGTPFFGASVSGRISATGQARTSDNDNLGDLIIGAPGFGLVTQGSNPPTTSRNTAGSAFLVEGRFLPLALPTSTAITTTIGIGQPKAPFAIDANNPAALPIYVYSNAAANFAPVTQINPATIVVNGIAFPTATVAADPVDENGDGIPDAIVTITPRSSLLLPNGTVTFTVSGRTNAASANRRFTGTASVTVTGSTTGGNTGGGVTFAGLSVGPGVQSITSFSPPLGERLVPSLTSLSTLTSYQPLPISVAINQFLPQGGFRLRQLIANGSVSSSNPNVQHREVYDQFGTTREVHTLRSHVFTRNPYHPGKVLRFTHQVPVVPIGRQREVYP